MFEESSDPYYIASCPGAASPIGHYSQAVKLPNGLVLFSGMKAWHPETGELTGSSIGQQTDLVFDNLEASLSHLGLTLSNVIRIQCHLAHEQDYGEFNAAYARRLGNSRPVRTTLAGYSLRGGALVELVADAYRAID